MQGNETETRRDIEPAPIDPRLAQQNEAVRQMEAEGFMAPTPDATDPAPPVAAGARP